MEKHSYRTLWLSDLHLGTKASRAEDLLVFLNQIRANTIYLVGDIVDFQRLRSKLRFPQTHWQVVSRLIQLANDDTRVFYIPGNHDFELRQVAGRTFFDIQICNEHIHTTVDGRRLLTFHGDILDGAIRKNSNLERFGAAAYAWLVEADVLQNQLRARFGKDYLPLSTHIKMQLKSAQQYIQRFEETAIQYARQHNVNGVVCGHIHRPCLRRDADILYANDGDWVEHRSAVAEDQQGSLLLLKYHAEKIHVLSGERPTKLAA